ncbi:hypothetical protein SAMN05216411_1218 [Nitrosospira multiformis]|nr:hypothetical protein SAMN05216411_1218 [Nitrosospira multiformis]
MLSERDIEGSPWVDSMNSIASHLKQRENQTLKKQQYLPIKTPDRHHGKGGDLFAKSDLTYYPEVEADTLNL